MCKQKKPKCRALAQVIGTCIVTLGTSGCAARMASDLARVDRPSVIRAMQDAYERTEREFARAAFWKPNEADAPARIAQLAPLIVQEVIGDPEHDAPNLRFGALAASPSGNTAIDLSHPTVYFAQSTIKLRGADRTRIDYVWFYPSSADTAHPARATRVSAILGDDGFAVVWIADEWSSGATPSEALRPTHRTYYVADSLEAGALDNFGAALPDRRFAVERRIEESPDVIVARMIEDGPMPMGIYVYLSHRPHRITTLLCRCSPSQMQQITESGYYHLRPLDDLDRLFQSLNVREMRRDDRNRKPKHDYTTLEDALRWPDQ